VIRRAHRASAALLLTFFLGLYHDAAVSARALHRIGLIAHDHVELRAAPSARARVLTVLVQETQVEVLEQRGTWRRVTIWASVQGWVYARDIVFGKPWNSVSTYQPPEIHYTVRAHRAESIIATAQAESTVSLYSSPTGHVVGVFRAGSVAAITAWQQDRKGKIWYQIRGRWAPGNAIVFRTPDPGTERRGHVPVWQAAGGKGMWLTLGTVADSAPDALIRAARRNGVSHLYIEAAISPLGFHGKDVVGPLIDAAHGSKISVLAWIFPYLYDLASDVMLTRQVASFRTVAGATFDGAAVDLERNVTLSNVRAYSQLIRAYLGPTYLLVGVTYPPQSSPDFPFREVARQYNLIAPMDYWHQTTTTFGSDYGHMRYGYAYGFRYAVDSVGAIRKLSGHVPIAPIGQAFDNFGRLEMGPHAPSAAETNGFLAGSKLSGAVGASFFQWMTATVGEWRAIQTFRF